MSLLHPLAEPSFQWRNHHGHATIDFNDPQPVLVNGNIYMKGKSDKNGQLRLWKYNIAARTFSELMCPQSCSQETESKIYVLTSDNSNLLLLNVHLSYPDPPPEPYYETDRYGERFMDYYASGYRHYQDSCLSQSTHDHTLNIAIMNPLESERSQRKQLYIHKCIDPLAQLEYENYNVKEMYRPKSTQQYYTDNRSRDPLQWAVSAACSESYLFVAFHRLDKYNDYDREHMTWEEKEEGLEHEKYTSVKIIVFNKIDGVYRHLKDVSIDSSTVEGDITKPLLFVHKDNIFLKYWIKFENKNSCNFQKSSLISLTCTDKSSHPVWQDSNPIHDIHSNITFLGGEPVVGLIDPADKNKLHLCTLTFCKGGDAWVEIASFDARFNTTPIMVGLPDGSKFIAIGNHATSGELHVLEVNPQGIYPLSSTSSFLSSSPLSLSHSL